MARQEYVNVIAKLEDSSSLPTLRITYRKAPLLQNRVFVKTVGGKNRINVFLFFERYFFF